MCVGGEAKKARRSCLSNKTRRKSENVTAISKGTRGLARARHRLRVRRCKASIDAEDGRLLLCILGRMHE